MGRRGAAGPVTELGPPSLGLRRVMAPPFHATRGARRPGPRRTRRTGAFEPLDMAPFPPQGVSIVQNRWMSAFVCLVEIRLHFGEIHDLKGKRKLLVSLKAQLRQKFGASVAEIDGQDKWQRSTLLCALVGGSEVEERAEALRRFAESRFPEGCSSTRRTLSLDDLEP